MIDNKQIIQSITAIQAKSMQEFHRYMVVFSGSYSWCINLVESYLVNTHHKTSLIVSDQLQITNICVQAPNKLPHLLGSEYDTLIWDGFSGINPDAFGIASGLLKGGGLFLIMLPEFESFTSSPDPDFLRLYSDKDSNSASHPFFLKRLVDHLKNSPDISIFEEGKALVKTKNGISSTTAPHAKSIQLPTRDQLAAIEAIKKVSTGHRHRPLVIKANRGRGKSSVLGIAAAQLFIETQQAMIITAPSKKTCDAAFQHFRSEIEQHFSSHDDIKAALKAFQFVPIDLLVSELPSCHLLFIDEAAAIPTSILTLTLKHYARVIYATTIHGYEGNGQGFAIRFQKALSEIRPQWQSLSLSTPIRWQEHDPLESWFFKFLLLAADLPETQKLPNQQDSRSQTVASPVLTHTTQLSQRALYNNEPLLTQIMSLLVSAHYQTKPSDLRMILDHPKISILVSSLLSEAEMAHESLPELNAIVGVCLVIEEGGVQSSELAEAIIAGTRRPRGQLFPQALCASSANSELLRQKSYRVMRIAVHPDYQHHGIGSRLLDDLYEFAQSNTADSVSTSYGLSLDLFTFWRKNNFEVVKLGSRIDGASGLQSVMMMRAISKPAKAFLKEHSAEFLRSFIFNINRTHQNFSSEFVIALFQALSHVEMKSAPFNRIKIEAFANALRPYEESDLDIFEFVLSKIRTRQWHKLEPTDQSLLVIKVLQNRAYEFCLKHFNVTGRKQFELSLRKALGALLDTET